MKNKITVEALSRNIKEVCNILRRGKAKGALNYIPELSWMLFLRFFDILEIDKEKKLKALGQKYYSIIEKPYRWRDWAAPYNLKNSEKSKDEFEGWKRYEIDKKSKSLVDFVNSDLFIYLKKLKNTDNSYSKIISLIFKLKEKTILKYDTNLKDSIDKIHEFTSGEFDTTYMFPLSQAYEKLLPSLGEKGGDGGQFFTPREIVRVIIETVNPKLNSTIYDPCCGTGGFFVESYQKLLKKNPSPKELNFLKSNCFWGIEDSDDTIILLLANLILHEIENPNILHGNTLTGSVDYGDLFQDPPKEFDYIFTNPPFGSKESKAAQSRFAYKCAKAQVLFLQEIIDKLKVNGECGLVIDEGVLFHSKTKAFFQTKKKLLNECDVYCIVSLPQKTFVNVNAGSKTNIVFFKKGRETKRIWYYDMSLDQDLKERNVTKGNPLRFDEFNDFFYRMKLPNDHKDKISKRSWYVNIDEIKKNKLKIHCKNRNVSYDEVKQDPKIIFKNIQKNQKSINAFIKQLIDN